MFWTAEADTNTVLLAEVPSALPSDSNLFAGLDAIESRADEHGIHFLHGGGGQTHRIVRQAGVAADVPVAALVPLDSDGFDRIDAITRLIRALQGRTVPDDRRLTSQQRRRFRHMLQAADGRANGASYREIAAIIFGVDRVSAEPWKTSALRDATTSLVKDGFAMIAGGYRALLRRRRQF